MPNVGKGGGLNMKSEITRDFAINNARMWVKGAIIEAENTLYWNKKMLHFMRNLKTYDRKEGRKYK